MQFSGAGRSKHVCLECVQAHRRDGVLCLRFDIHTTLKGNAMQTEVLRVSGMTCGGCTSKVAHALEAMPGVSDAQVSLSPGMATVTFDEHRVSSEQLKLVVEQAGYGVDAPGSASVDRAKGGCCG
jgi:copper chaperone CopZ